VGGTKLLLRFPASGIGLYEEDGVIVTEAEGAHMLDVLWLIVPAMGALMLDELWPFHKALRDSGTHNFEFTV
jgi:hypothetical protein